MHTRILLPWIHAIGPHGMPCRVVLPFIVHERTHTLLCRLFLCGPATNNATTMPRSLLLPESQYDGGAALPRRTNVPIKWHEYHNSVHAWKLLPNDRLSKSRERLPEHHLLSIWNCEPHHVPSRELLHAQC